MAMTSNRLWTRRPWSAAASSAVVAACLSAAIAIGAAAADGDLHRPGRISAPEDTSVQAHEGARLALVGGFAFVEVFLNGHGPFHMLLDSGASSCAVTPAVARQAGLAPDRRVELGSWLGHTLVAVSDAQIAVGGTESRAEVLVTEVAGVRAVDAKADGMLGQSFLAQRPYLIDYRARRLYLGAEAMDRARRLPVSIASAPSLGRMMVPVALGESAARWRLVLDSGASDLIVLCGKRCPKLCSRETTGRIVMNAGEAQVARGTLAVAKVAELPFPNAHAALLDTDAAGGEEDGVLPTRWFAAVYVDAERNEIRLEKW